jgi:tetrahedral aminopeptidase
VVLLTLFWAYSPVEVVSLEDLDQTAQLLAEFCLNVTPQTDWTP